MMFTPSLRSFLAMTSYGIGCFIFGYHVGKRVERMNHDGSPDTRLYPGTSRIIVTSDMDIE